MTSVLRAEDLVVRRGRRTVIDGASVSVDRGEIVAVLGPNGAGKSTLLAAINGTLPLAGGRVDRDGRVATVLQSPALARRTALANVELALAWWHVPRSRRRSLATAALTRMRAEHLASRPGRSLSGGEQRRIHLARAVAVAPDLLLLDEPFDGLDPQTHATLRDDTAQALREAGRAVLVVLHDRVDAWAMADRIVVVMDGRIAADGPPQRVLDDPPSAAVARFLGYDGELTTTDGLLLTRPHHVRIDGSGELTGRVVHTVGIEDGLRVQVRTPRGVVWTRDWTGSAGVGDEVHLAVVGGRVFSNDGAGTQA